MELANSIKIAILQRFVGKTVVIIPWSHAFNEKLTLAPKYKTGTLHSIGLDGVCSVYCPGLSTTNFAAHQLLPVTSALSDILPEHKKIADDLIDGNFMDYMSDRYNDFHRRDFKTSMALIDFLRAFNYDFEDYYLLAGKTLSQANFTVYQKNIKHYS